MIIDLPEDVVTSLRGAAKSEAIRRVKRNQKPNTSVGVVEQNRKHIARLNVFLDHPKVKATEYR